ncbi:MAG: hypothetical protein QW632_03780 [Ignisphaera sp.]
MASISSPRLCLDRDCMSLMVNYLLDLYRIQLYEYNRMIKSYGVYLKPMHIVVKKSATGLKTYYYFGRYWYRIETVNSRVKWIYLGSRKPFENIPDPPINPILLISIEKSDANSKTVCIHNESFAELSEQISRIVRAFSVCCKNLDRASEEEIIACVSKRFEEYNEHS